MGVKSVSADGWQEEPPEKPGWYWWQPPYSRAEVVEVIGVTERGLTLCRLGMASPQGGIVMGLWSGPIRPPVSADATGSPT